MIKLRGRKDGRKGMKKGKERREEGGANKEVIEKEKG